MRRLVMMAGRAGYVVAGGACELGRVVARIDADACPCPRLDGDCPIVRGCEEGGSDERDRDRPGG